ncbi:MAG: O-antigen ligase family protein [Clostridia bacterium]|nr:O-antigen ligase family protein [Clostridia bacterium]
MKKIYDFSVSENFIWLATLIVFVGWATKAWAAMLCVLALLCALPLYFGDSNKTLLTFFFQFTFIISSGRHALNDYWWLLFLLLPLLVGVVFQTIRYRKKMAWKILSLKNIKGQNFFLLLFSVPFAIGGITRQHEKPVVVILAFAIILLIGAVYSFFMASNYGREDKKELPTYVLKNLIAVGVLISAQMLFFYASCGSMDAIIEAIRLKTHELGWGGPNNVGAMYTFTIPAAFYYCVKKGRWTPLFAILSMAEFAILLSTGSRGSIFVVLLALPAILLYTMAVTPNKKAFGITICVVIFIGLAVALWQSDKIFKALGDRFAMGLSSNGRLEFEYPAGWAAFKSHPIFGCGWDYMMGTKINDGYTPLWFHCSPLQVAAMMGVFGFIIYALWTFQRYRAFYLLRADKRVVYLAASMLLFEGYGLVDVAFFAPTFFIMMIIIVFSCEVNLPVDAGFAIPRKWFVKKPIEPADEG